MLVPTFANQTFFKHGLDTWLLIATLLIWTISPVLAAQHREYVTPTFVPLETNDQDLRQKAGRQFIQLIRHGSETGVTRDTICDWAKQLRVVDPDGTISPVSAVQRRAPDGPRYVTGYYLLALADEGCRTGIVRLLQLDRLTEDIAQDPANRFDHVPKCRAADEHYALDEDAYKILAWLLSRLGKLRMVVLSCVTIDFNDTVVLEGIRVEKFTLLDVQIRNLSLHGLQADLLTIANNYWNSNPNLSKRPPEQADSSLLRADFRNLEIADSNLINGIFVVGVTADEITLNGVKGGALQISRNEAQSLFVHECKFESIRVFQDYLGSISFYRNDVAGKLTLGRYDNHPSATGAERQDEAELGPRPPWIPDIDPYMAQLAVAGWLELYDSAIGDDVAITADVGPPEALPLRVGKPMLDKQKLIRLRRVSAKAIHIVDSNIYLSMHQAVSIERVQIEGEIGIERSSIMHYTQRNGVNVWLNMADDDARSAAAALLFYETSSHAFHVKGSRIEGTISINDLTSKFLSFDTPVPSKYAPVSPNNRCIGETDLRGRATLPLVGSGAVTQLEPLPADLGRLANCYGSASFSSSHLDSILLLGAMTDVFMPDTEVSRSLKIGGRIAGVINLSQSAMKEASLQLGGPDLPLTWCEDSQLILENSRFQALIADQSSFTRVNCKPGISGAARAGELPLSLRGAKFEQILGAPRHRAADRPDPGLLGLDSDRLIGFGVGPTVASTSVSKGASDEVQEHSPDEADAKFDPETLANLAGLLKASGYAGKATDLTIARVRRQLWEGGRVDRAKYIVGWPIGWGFQLEWAFVYGFALIGLGAWIAAYYRRHPTAEPFPPSRLCSQAKPQEVRLAQQRRQAVHRFLAVCSPLLVLYLLAIEAPLWLRLSEAKTGGLIASIAVVLMLTIGVAVLRHYRKDISKLLLSVGEIDLHAVFFSLDRFLPAPGFHNHWGNYPRIGQAGRNYFYIHRFLGLILVTLVTAGLAGLFD